MWWCKRSGLFVMEVKMDYKVWLAGMKKRWAFMQGPAFDCGEKVLIVKDNWLKLPRKVSKIGWNETTGFYFFALEGIKAELFKTDQLMEYNDISDNILKFKPSKLEQKLFEKEIV